MEDVKVGLRDFSRKFNAIVFDETNQSNAGGSALGAWINLVLLSHSLKDELSGDEQEILNSLIGVDIDSAFEYLVALLGDIPEPLSLAVGFWYKESHRSKILSLIESVKESNSLVTTIPVNQDPINSWVNENTRGIIQELPDLDLANPDLYALLINVLSVKIQWLDPFDSVSKNDNMKFWKDVDQVLFDSNSSISFGTTNSGSNFAVLKSVGYDEDYADRVNVYSLIGDSDASSQDLYDSFLKSKDSLVFSSTIDLSYVEELESWDFITMRKQKIMGGNPNVLKLESLVPAWSASNSLDLDKGLGYEILNGIYLRLDMEVKTKQHVVSKFNRLGYEAAAATVSSVLRAASMPRIVECPIATINFNKPFVVVAFADSKNFQDWNEIPLFVHTVKEASEVE